MIESKYIAQYLPTLIVLCAVFVTAVIFYLISLVHNHHRERSSITQEFLRSPGQSLLETIGGLNGNIQILVCYLSVLPFIIYTSLISTIHFRGRDWNIIDIIMVILIGAVFMVWLSFKLIKKIDQRKNSRISYEGKLTTGQELNQLMIQGCYVYHDFPADKYNIDHIVVGSKGVFAVETIASVIPESDNRKQDVAVEYNGHALHFPDFTDLETVERAQDKAEWLSKWLSSVVEEPLAARAIVSIPGWYIKRTSADGISVVNPGQFDSLFEHINSRDLNESLIKRIVERFEQECRGVVCTPE